MKRRTLLAALGVSGVSGCLRLQNSSGGTRTLGDGEPTDGTPTTLASTTTATAATAEPPGTETPTESTPTEEPTDSPEEVSYPVGISDDGVNEFLYGEHTRNLETRSFRTSWEKLNRTYESVPHAKSYRVDDGLAIGEWVRPFTDGTVSMYREGSVGLWREDIGGSYIYGRDETGFDWNKLAWEVEVRALLSALEWGTPERVADGGATLWELRGKGVENNSATPGYTNENTIKNLAEAVLRVDENSIIRDLRAVYSRENVSAGKTENFETRYGVSEIGRVSLSVPSWVETAREQRPRVRATYENDRQFVAVTMESGSRIPANESRLVVYETGSSDKRYSSKLSESVEPGDTVYLWRDASDSAGAVRIARGAPPSDVSPVQLDGALHVAAYRRTSAYFVDVAVE
jgi:hypothetical protein